MGTSSSNEIFSSLARHMGVPVFMPTEMSYSTCSKSDYVITMTPSIVEAIVDIMDYFDWNCYVYYIFDSNEGKVMSLTTV